MFNIGKDKVEAAALKLLQAIKDTGELPTAGRFSLRINHEVSFKPPGEPKVKKTYTITISEEPVITVAQRPTSITSRRPGGVTVLDPCGRESIATRKITEE